MWAVIWFIAKLAITAYVGMAVSALLQKKQEMPVIEPDALDVPTQREGTKYTIIFGLGWVENPVIDWYGNVTTEAVLGKSYHQDWNFRPEWGMHVPTNDKSYYATGYMYKVGMNLILCQGVCDGVLQLKFNDIVAWPEPAYIHQLADDGETLAEINEGSLFGGLTYDNDTGLAPNGGGVIGNVRFNYGLSSQTQNAYLVTQLGSDVSACRGLTTMTLENVNVGTSRFIPKVSALLKRINVLTDGSEQWYIAKADISNSLNAIHIIRECLTNTEWGMKVPSSLLNDVTWQAAADTLYTEGFGLCLKWEDQNQTLKDFVNDVLRHINASLYEEPSTGEIIIKLIRDDYVVDDLDTYDESDIVEISNFDRGSVYESVNTLQLQFWNIYENQPVSIPDHDIASMNMQDGKWVEKEVSYNGIVDAALAGKIIARERQQAGSFPVVLQIKSKRTMSGLRPGDVFIMNYTNPEISEMVMRVIQVNFGTLTNGIITLQVIQDVFSIQPALYASTPDSAWVNPAIEPLLCPDVLITETPYMLMREYIVDDASFATIVADVYGYPLILAYPPSNSGNYELMFRADSGDAFVTYGTKSYAESVVINENIPATGAEVVVSINTIPYILWKGMHAYARSFEDAAIIINYYYANLPFFINNEILIFKSINYALTEITFYRGGWDTVPQAHSTGDYGYFIETSRVILDELIPAGDIPGIKILPNTVNGTLPEVDADIVNADAFNSRLVRPYPPDDIKINGTSYASTFSGQPTITWYHRDRTNVSVVQYTGYHGISSPEVGTTYTLKIYDQSNNLVRIVTGISGLTYTYTYDDEIDDCGLSSGDTLNSSLRFVLNSVRGGYDSWQSIDITVARV